MARLGTFTGLYYMSSTLSAIVGPNVNGWAIQLSGNNYNVIMLIAFVLMLGVRRGEATSAQRHPLPAAHAASPRGGA